MTASIDYNHVPERQSAMTVKWGETRLARRSAWESGPPPCHGWWEASLLGGPTRRRFWNGSNWSHFCQPGLVTADEAARVAALPSEFDTEEIAWRGLALQSDEQRFRAALKERVEKAVREAA